MEHKIDATNKTVGRVATEAAMVLMGKNTPHYKRNQNPEVTVVIENASKVRITTPKKLKMKTYQRYSGYPGGLKVSTMEEVIEKKGYGEIFRKAVHGMLPANKLRKQMMKNLVINE